jgi:hypothetical protein
MVTRTSRPLCAALREFQNNWAKHLRPRECRQFCNTHARVVANSAPAESAAMIFLRAITNHEWKPARPVPEQCDFCKRMNDEKELRLKEIAKDLHDQKPRQWLHDYGMVCSRHGREVVAKLPENLRDSMQELMARSSNEIAEMPRNFLQQVEKGHHSGGGILGRAAEWLVALRGMES